MVGARNDMVGAKGGKWVNHDCHDLGMMGMMCRPPLALWIPAFAGMTWVGASE